MEFKGTLRRLDARQLNDEPKKWVALIEVELPKLSKEEEYDLGYAVKKGLGIKLLL
jgi:hypothetical protein